MSANKVRRADEVIVAVGFTLGGVTGVVTGVGLRVIGCTRLIFSAICLILLSAGGDDNVDIGGGGDGRRDDVDTS